MHVVRCAHNDVQWKRRIDGKADLHRLVDLVPSRHHDQNVDIAVGVRRTVGVRTEEDDFIGLEAFGDLACESAYDRSRHIGAAIPAMIDGDGHEFGIQRSDGSYGEL